jgi:pimeloyl-ACP methyl ester carboxylesterase
MKPEPCLRHRTIAADGVRLHAVEAGPADGRLLILLHGFPELWYGWRHQIGPLAEAGFRVLAPDQRGYNLSDKPHALGAYRLDRLAADVAALIDDAGHERAFLAGHDWGGAVAWWFGMTYPQRLDRLALLSSPHPYVMGRHLRRSGAQRRRSWYMYYFQLPFLPEINFRRRHWSAGERSLTATSRPGTFTRPELDVYRQAWAQPGAVTGMLSWYRAGFRHPPPRPESLRVTVPSLLIWGRRDRFLGAEMAQPSLDLCDDGRLVFLDASHWVHHEEPDTVNALLADFFLTPSGGRTDGGEPPTSPRMHTSPRPPRAAGEAK